MEPAMDEDDLPARREAQVWFSRQVFAVKAIAKPGSVGEVTYNHFGDRVSPPHLAHELYLAGVQ
jgi:hypothetical protein